MADDTVYTIEIVFKTAPHAPVRYRIRRAELHRLTERFNESAAREVCDVETEQGEPRRLFLIFDEIVYIG